MRKELKYFDLFIYSLIFLGLWAAFAISDQYFIGAKLQYYVVDHQSGDFGIGLNWISMHPLLWRHLPTPSFNQVSGILVWLTNLDGTDKPIYQFVKLGNLLQAVLVIAAGLWFAWVSNPPRLA